MRNLEADELPPIADTAEVRRFLQERAVDGCWYRDLQNPEKGWVSPSFRRLLGLDAAPGASGGSAPSDYLFEEDRGAADTDLARYISDSMRHGSNPYEHMRRYRHADGSAIWVRTRGIVLRDADGTPMGQFEAQSDLTELRRVEAQRDRLKAEEEVAIKELRAFAYSVSHDLKSPANSLLMLLGELQRDSEAALAPEGRELLSLCQSTVSEMNALIEDLLAYSRLLGTRPAMEDIDLDALLDDVLISMKDLVADTGVRLHRKPLPVIRGAPAPLHLLFENLLDNAIKFARPGVAPEVFVCSTACDNGMVRISVRDNGIGISPQYHERVFDMFKRLHTSDEIPGSGLGLALCRRVARDHNSDIELCSTPGQGATFSIYLTLGRAQP